MSHAPSFERHIVVDMTPLEPNGQNGGAGVVATSLVSNLSALAPEAHFTLLTANDSHAELASLEADNVQRSCVVTRSSAPRFAREVLDRALPPRVRVRLKRAYRRVRTARSQTSAVDNLRPDLLFCPFTLTSFWRPGVPCVSIVHDLQHLAHPAFFTPEQRLNRQRHVEEAVGRSERVVCVSDYVRGMLLANVEMCAERAVTIRWSPMREQVAIDPGILARLGLHPLAYLLYPANFWPHKNHRRLFEALRLYHASHPDSQLTLVCTGAPNAFMNTLATEAPRDVVVFAGYVSESELEALLDACAALIFPSLHEGFGMPVLEAMARGKPVLCSDATSLPEVAGDAAVYFDPTDVRQIASAIEALHDQSRLADLVERGRRRASDIGTARDVAARYLEQFDQVLAASAARA